MRSSQPSRRRSQSNRRDDHGPLFPNTGTVTLTRLAGHRWTKLGRAATLNEGA